MTREMRRVILLLSAVQFIFTLDTTFMNVSISTLVKDLNTTVTGVQSAITLYALVMAAFMIAGAKLGDIIGRKKAFIIGLCIYATGSLITSLSPNIHILMFGWSLLEGLGAALAIPAMFSLITGNFKAGPTRARAYATLAAMAAVGAAAGPIVGGLLTTYSSWRLGFAGEVLIAAWVLMQHKSIHDAKLETAKPKFDFVGFLLSALGLTVLVFGILLASSYGIVKARSDYYLFGVQVAHQGGVSPTIIFALLGIVILLCFVGWQAYRTRNNKPALLNPVLFRNRTVTAGISGILMQQFLMAGVIFTLSLILQIGLGYNAFQTGLTILPLSVLLLLFARLGAKLVEMYEPRTLAMVGFAVLSLGILYLGVRTGKADSGMDYIIPMMIMGAGLGLVASQLSNLVQSSVKSDQTSEASGLSSTFQNLGSSLGTALAGSITIAILVSASSSLIASNTVLTTQQKNQYTQTLQTSAQVVSNQSIEQNLAHEPEQTVDAVVSINEQARNKALSTTVIMLGAIGLLGVVSTFMLPKTKQAH